MITTTGTSLGSSASPLTHHRHHRPAEDRPDSGEQASLGDPEPPGGANISGLLNWMTPPVPSALTQLLRQLLGQYQGGTPATSAPAAGPPPMHDSPGLSGVQVGPSTPGKFTAGVPPKGYHAIKGSVPTSVGKVAKSLLGKPFGTRTPFSVNGQQYMARNEPHYHPPGYVGGPTGWHQGVTVYAANP